MPTRLLKKKAFAKQWGFEECRGWCFCDVRVLWLCLSVLFLFSSSYAFKIILVWNTMVCFLLFSFSCGVRNCIKEVGGRICFSQGNWFPLKKFLRPFTVRFQPLFPTGRECLCHVHPLNTPVVEKGLLQVSCLWAAVCTSTRGIMHLHFCTGWKK